jgi:pyridoxine 5-phosphate synthase
MARLSVNVNKVAVLRNSRGGREPDVVRAAAACLDAGAHGITVHPRPDARHIRADDVAALADLTRARGVEFNLEGNPFAPARPGYPGFLALCAVARPAQATLVPDDDGQITSDHGFDFSGDLGPLRARVAELRALGCRVSLFVDAGCPRVGSAAEVGADRIELYTGPYAAAHAAGAPDAALAGCVETARARVRGRPGRQRRPRPRPGQPRRFRRGGAAPAGSLDRPRPGRRGAARRPARNRARLPRPPRRRTGGQRRRLTACVGHPTQEPQRTGVRRRVGRWRRARQKKRRRPEAASKTR